MSGSPRLNRRMTLETAERTADGAGGFVEAWQALGTLWVMVDPGSGAEVLRGELAMSSQRLTILCRAAPVGASDRPMAGQRFREGERLFRIEAVAAHDVAQRYLACRVREEVTA